MVEPIFPRVDLRLTTGNRSVFEMKSAGSGKTVSVHFCATCGTKLYLTFERFPDHCGVYTGTFDDPNWFEIGPQNAKHIFIDVARHDTILPPEVKAFGLHAMTNDGRPNQPVVFDAPQVVGRKNRIAAVQADKGE
jgi:hypothetical protein